MNQAALITIANELNHDQMRVLMALLAELDYENYIPSCADGYCGSADYAKNKCQSCGKKPD